MNKQPQLQEFDRAYGDFVILVRSLTPEQLRMPVGGWCPRDILAHLIGWNHNILTGCKQVLGGVAPFYHIDGPNDYRSFNAGFVVQYDSADAQTLLGQLAVGRDALRDFLEGVSETDWAKDFGAQHYRGGPATVGRCIESLTTEYREHGREIAAGTRPNSS